MQEERGFLDGVLLGWMVQVRFEKEIGAAFMDFGRSHTTGVGHVAFSSIVSFSYASNMGLNRCEYCSIVLVGCALAKSNTSRSGNNVHRCTDPDLVGAGPTHASPIHRRQVSILGILPVLGSSTQSLASGQSLGVS